MTAEHDEPRGTSESGTRESGTRESGTRRRPTFVTGLSAGLVGGTLVGAAVAVATLVFLPGSVVETLRGDQAEAPSIVDATPSPTPTPLPTDAWLDSVTALPIDVTQPGTVVALGEPATVQLAGADGARTLVEITVVSIDVAPNKDQRTLRNAAPVLTGQNVYYARASARWVAGDPLNSTTVGDLFTMLDADGTVIPALTLLDWDACTTPATPASFATPTDTTDWCVAAASPAEGLVPVGLRFSQAGGPYDSPDVDASVRWAP